MTESANIVITGANTGIGAECARILAPSGARVWLCCRDLSKANIVRDAIRARGLRAESVHLDLSDLGSVQACASELCAALGKVDVLINNAGLAGRRGSTEQGFELTFGVNHLGHFLFTQLLLPRLLEGAPSRVINVTSTAHYRCKSIEFDALRAPTRSRTGFPEYRVSKLANILHTKELDRRYGALGLLALAVHPGVVRSDVWREVPAPFRGFIKLFMISSARGAEHVTRLVSADPRALSAGGYYHERALRPPSALARDGALAERLWESSQEWVQPYL